MKNNITELVFILDRSGSMSGLESDTIGGFNSMIEKQKKQDGGCYVSTVLFDDESEVLHDRVKLYDIPKMTDNDYTVRGCTALIDAIGGVPIYVDKGKFVKRAEIESFDITKGKDGLYTKTKILSTGNSKIRYTGKFQIIKGKKLIDEYPIDSKVVASNGHYVATQKIKADKIKEAGDYTIRMVLNYFDENDNKKSIKEDAILRITGEI